MLTSSGSAAYNQHLTSCVPTDQLFKKGAFFSFFLQTKVKEKENLKQFLRRVGILGFVGETKNGLT